MGGRSFFYRPRCKGKGCPKRCPELDAVWQMDRIRRCDPAFVGIEDVCGGSFPAYAANADKISGSALWVASVLTPPEDPHLVKERVNKRVQRLIKSGVKVECVLVPSDGMTIIVSTADLAEEKVRGRKQLAPTSGLWCPPCVALLFLSRTLASTAVNGRVWWTTGWQAPKPPKRAWALSGRTDMVTKTAYRILQSENYEFSGSLWDDDPMDVLLDARGRAESFWDDPRCTRCDGEISREDDHWWHGSAMCGVCDLARVLAPILTGDLTEREIESHLRYRRLTFKRRRALLEEALGRAGAEKLSSGMWRLRSAGEVVA